MRSVAATHDVESCCRKNLAALAARQPRVAARLEATAVPDHVRFVTGRDGTPTCRLDGPEGRSVWYGGSSMPRISAEEVLAGFAGDGRNVVLPGVLAGVEPIALAAKLPPHAAVFVLEAEPLQLALALRLHNYIALIESGRLIFVPGVKEGFADELRDWFTEHPGYEFPAHLLPAPQRTEAQLAEVRTALESAGKLVAEAQSAAIAEQLARIHNAARNAARDAPRVAVLGVDPLPASLDQARRIERALRRLGWEHTVCVPDAPSRCHLSARLADIERAGANLVILLNTVSGLCGAHLQTDIRVVSWYLPGARIPSGVGGASPNVTVCFTSSRSLRDELIRAGWESDTLRLCGVAADTVAFYPLNREIASPDRKIAVIGGLPDAGADACGLRLDSHRAIWRAATDIARRRVGCDVDIIADDVFGEAERAIRITLQDAELRRIFVRLIHERLTPVARARAVAEALVAAGRRIELWGVHWPPLDMVPDPRRGPIPGSVELNQVFNAAEIVVTLGEHPSAVETALDAMASGAMVACFGRAEAFGQEHPDLIDIADGLGFFTTPAELVRRVETLTNLDAGLAERLEAVRERLRTRHSVARRLEQILELALPSTG